MTGHLTAEEQVDLLDGGLAPDRTAHVAVCVGCQAEAARLREVAARAAAAHVPEPSPLFWEHQAARLSAIVAGEPVARSRPTWAFAAWVAGAAAVASVGLLLVRSASTPPPAPVEAGPRARTAAAALSEPASRDAADERAWSVVEELGGEIDSDAAAEALAPARGAADRALEDLSADERAALARLLQREMGERKG